MCLLSKQNWVDSRGTEKSTFRRKEAGNIGTRTGKFKKKKNRKKWTPNLPKALGVKVDEEGLPWRSSD